MVNIGLFNLVAPAWAGRIAFHGACCMGGGVWRAACMVICFSQTRLLPTRGALNLLICSPLQESFHLCFYSVQIPGV